MQSRNKLVQHASRASVFVALTLTALKIYAVYATQSLSILSSLLDSFMDLLASLGTLVAVTFANRPADKKFRFGYGKLEAIAALSQSILIIVSVLLLIAEALQQFFKHKQQLEHPGIGIIVMCISIALTLCLTLFQQHVIKHTNSIAIKADALHYKTDIAVNIAVLISLYLSQFYPGIDSISCLMISIYIIWATKDIIKESLGILLDKEINHSDREKIINLITSHPKILGLHNLRTRTSGKRVFIEVHLEMNPNLTLIEAHTLSHEIKDLVEANFPGSEIITHQDPAGHDPEPEDTD